MVDNFEIMNFDAHEFIKKNSEMFTILSIFLFLGLYLIQILVTGGISDGQKIVIQIGIN